MQRTGAVGSEGEKKGRRTAGRATEQEGEGGRRERGTTEGRGGRQMGEEEEDNAADGNTLSLSQETRAHPATRAAKRAILSSTS